MHKFFSTLIAVFVYFYAHAQSLSILSACKSRLFIDKRPKNYFIKNRISRDTLLFTFNKGLADKLKEEKIIPEFLALPTDKQKAFEQLKLYTKKVTVKSIERKPPSKYAFFRFFRKKHKTEHIFFIKPQQLISEQAALLGENPLIIITRLRIDNKWALNLEFRNRTLLRADYTIYSANGMAQTHYRTKLLINMQKDIKVETFLHFQRKLGELCAESIISDITLTSTH